MISRADIGDAVDISVRLTDPVGRSTESLATINPGHILPAPMLGDFVLKKSIVPPGSSLTWTSTTPLIPGAYLQRVIVARPPIRFGTFTIPQPAISLQMALSDVPLDEPGPVPAGSDPLRVRRMPGPGPNFVYYAFVRVPFTQIIVRQTSVDGRIAEHSESPV